MPYDAAAHAQLTNDIDAKIVERNALSESLQQDTAEARELQ